MNNVSLNLHTAQGIQIRRYCINGNWQLRIAIDLENDGQANLTVFADTREALDVEFQEETHCRIVSDDPVIEYSKTPFSAQSSANKLQE